MRIIAYDKMLASGFGALVSGTRIGYYIKVRGFLGPMSACLPDSGRRFRGERGSECRNDDRSSYGEYYRDSLPDSPLRASKGFWVLLSSSVHARTTKPQTWNSNTTKPTTDLGFGVLGCRI